MFPGSACESRIDLALSARVQYEQLAAKDADRRLHVGKVLGAGLNPRIGKKAYHVCLGHDLAQQFEPLRHQPAIVKRHARDVAAGPVQALDNAGLDRIAAIREYDRYRRRCRFGGERGIGGSPDENHGNLTANQLAGHDLKLIVLIGPAQFEGHVAPFDKTHFAETLAQRSKGIRVRHPSTVEKSNHWI